MKNRNWIFLVLFVFLAATAVWAASPQYTHRDTNTMQNTSQQGILDPGDIVKDSAKYIGQTVTVRGTVDKMLADGIFTLKEHKMAAFHNLLVIVPKGKLNTRIAEGSTLMITGDVSQFNKGDLEAKYGITGVDPKLVSGFDNKPVLVAASISESNMNSNQK